MTILSVCLNAALDITYAVPEFVPGATNRTVSVANHAGGKGINVARVLTQLDDAVLLHCLLGGATGQQVREDLEESRIPYDSVRTLAPTRRTVTIVDHVGAATVVTEPGGPIAPREWELALSTLPSLVADASVVVLSGSLPSGVPADAYALIVGVARARGVPSIVDAEGPGLLAAARAGAAVLKPNIHELRAAIECDDPRDGAQKLRDLGAGAVVVSLGEDGLLAVDSTGAWRARLPHPVVGNPTGAGDALVAALARGIARGQAWPELLRDGVALSAAAVLHPVAGGVDLEARYRFEPEVIVEGIG